MSHPASARARRTPVAGPAFVVILLIAIVLASIALPSRVRAQADALPRSDDAAALSADLAFVAPDGRIGWLPAGTTRVALLGDVGSEYAFPVFSPDGDRLAAIDRSGGGARAVVFDLRGDAPEAAAATTWFFQSDAPVIYLDWRDDGRALLLLTGDPRGFALRTATVGGAPDTGGADAGASDADASDPGASDPGPVPWTTGAPLFWDQAPDGVIVHVGGPGEARLSRFTAAGEEATEWPSPGAFRSPAVSPSGRWLAYGEATAGDVRRLVITRRDGDDDRRALDVRGLTAFAWHPTRDQLALTRPFTDVPHSFGPLGGLDAESGLFEPWTDASVLAFWWSPDGSAVAVLATQPPEGGQVAGRNAGPTLAGAAGGGGPTRVASPATAPVATTQALPVQAAPLRLRVGLVDPVAGEVAWLGTVRPQNAFLNETVPFFDQYARSHAVWSPDGRWLALPTVDAQGRDVVGLLDVRSGELREIAPGRAPVFADR